MEGWGCVQTLPSETASRNKELSSFLSWSCGNFHVFWEVIVETKGVSIPIFKHVNNVCSLVSVQPVILQINTLRLFFPNPR